MLSIGRPDNGAQRLVGSSLKFIVDGVFVNGKMAVSSPGRGIGDLPEKGIPASRWSLQP